MLPLLYERQEYFDMQNVWKSIVVFMIAATVEAGNVEPVLMQDGGGHRR